MTCCPRCWDAGALGHTQAFLLSPPLARLAIMSDSITGKRKQSETAEAATSPRKCARTDEEKRSAETRLLAHAVVSLMKAAAMECSEDPAAMYADGAVAMAWDVANRLRDDATFDADVRAVARASVEAPEAEELDAPLITSAHFNNLFKRGACAALAKADPAISAIVREQLSGCRRLAYVVAHLEALLEGFGAEAADGAVSDREREYVAAHPLLRTHTACEAPHEAWDAGEALVEALEEKGGDDDTALAMARRMERALDALKARCHSVAWDAILRARACTR